VEDGAVIADALLAATRALADVHPDGWRLDGANGTSILVSGTRMSSLNGVFSRSLRPDAAEIARLAGLVACAGLPWSIVVRGEPGPDVLEVAAWYGRTGRHEMPMLACPAAEARLHSLVRSGPLGVGPLGAGPLGVGRLGGGLFGSGAIGGGAVEVRKIGADERKVFADTLAVSVGAPTEIVLSLMTEWMIDAPWADTYLVELDGLAVATGVGIRTGDQVGVYHIATVPEFRSCGFGRLVTERVLADGFAAGATAAYLQSSAMGRPLYESIGFRAVETWTYLT
jgi:GNAT superfamily N-acetyltransferase